MKTGPRATSGFDLALTELPEHFVVEIGSEAGSEIMRDTGWQLATAFDLGRAAQVIGTCRGTDRTRSADRRPAPSAV